MRSFAVIAGLAAAANAYAYGYPEYNTTSVAPPTYPESSAPGYPESSPAAEYPASSAVPEYPAHTTTAVVTGVSVVCSEATTLTYGSKTYTVSSSTTLIDNDCEYTTTYEVKPTPSAGKPTEAYTPPAGVTTPAGVYTPGPSAPAVPYPSNNATTAAPTGAKPSSTKPSTPEFTGAAAQAGVGLLAVIGAVAAFL